jgi:ubiquitin C-terminal hydrolase
MANDSFLTSLLYGKACDGTHLLGQYKSSFKCTRCHFVSDAYDEFNSIALPIKNVDGQTVQACLGEFTAWEQMPLEDSMSLCPNCSNHHMIPLKTKKLSITRAPKILCIQLKRMLSPGMLNYRV